VSEIVRFSVSLEDDLLEQFDRYCAEEHIATRSEAVRQVIRDTLTRRAWADDTHEVAGTLTLVYDHHRPQLRDKLVELQHDHTHMIVATLHAHLTHDLCMEVIVLRGPAGRLQAIASQLRGLKGIFKGELVMASAHGAGEHPPGDHAKHRH
jgi:CopG family transcriptional regulator, nickel-responsive regulator